MSAPYYEGPAERETTECSMCHGTGVYPYQVNPPEVKWGTCGACGGTGREVV